MTYVYYNLTNLTSAGNQTTILTFVSEINTLLDGKPALLMLLAIGFVIYFSLHSINKDVFRNFAATSFAMLVLTIILYPTGLIDGLTLLIFAILSPVSIFLLWVFGGRSFG